MALKAQENTVHLLGMAEFSKSVRQVDSSGASFGFVHRPVCEPAVRSENSGKASAAAGDNTRTPSSSKPSAKTNKS